MSNVQSLKSLTDSSISNKRQSISEKIKGRYSKELVISLGGPVGCNLSAVINNLKKALKQVGYHIEYIKLSDLITKSFEEIRKKSPNKIPADLKNIDISSSENKSYNHYCNLMDIGNFFRESYEKNVIAQYGVEEITHRRANLASPTFEKLDIDPKDSKKRMGLS